MSHSVLICDDSAAMRASIREILTGAGLSVVGEAENGVQAVARWRELRPDLVTMDTMMPQMGGIAALRRIVGEDPAAKVLLCSATGQQALVIEGIEAGARDFVVKPFQPARVLEALQRILA